MLGVQRLHHHRDGVAAAGARFDTKTLCGLGDAVHLVADCLHQPQHAIGAARGADQHRAHQALAQLLRQIVEHLVARRLDIFQQLLHQLVVVIGERFQHGEARGLFRIERRTFERHHFGRRRLFVDKGALQREIDETGDDVAVEGRQLPHHQFDTRRGLQRRQRIGDAGARLVDLVEKQDARNLLFFQFAQNQLQLRQLLVVEFADDDGRVDHRQHRAHVLREFDRAGAIDEGVLVAHEIRGGD